jgi:hypothetical protein
MDLIRQHSLKQLNREMSPSTIYVRDFNITFIVEGNQAGFRMKNIPKSRSFGNPQGQIVPNIQ